MSASSSFRSDAHAVIIGINEYQDAKIPNLKFARADAEGIYKILTDPELGRIPSEQAILLLDGEATAKNIRSAIGTKIPKRAGEKDMVYVYYAGHGAPVMDLRSRSRDGLEKYLVPTDAELDDLRATGIGMDEVQKFFGWIESKQVLFFIDSCYSGEAGGRTFQNPSYQGRHVMSAEFLEELASSEGRFVVTACDVNEVSLETPDMQHGLFTYYLMEGLKGLADKDQDGQVSVQELYEYVYDNVSRHARQLGGSMHPIQKGSIKGKIVLTQYETAAQKQAKALQARADELHRQAQAHYDAGRLDVAWAIWQNVLQLAPGHTAGQQGFAKIENKRQQEQRQRQEKLERQQRILLDLKRAGKLPVDEFNVALSMIERSQEELTGIEREIHEFLDDLIAGKISPENYLKSLRLLRQPPAREEPPPKAKEPPAKPEPAQKKPVPIVTKKPSPKPEPATAKPKPVAPAAPSVSLPTSEKQKKPSLFGNRKWLVAPAAVVLIIVTWAVINQILTEKPSTTLTPQQAIDSSGVTHPIEKKQIEQKPESSPSGQPPDVSKPRESTRISTQKDEKKKDEALTAGRLAPPPVRLRPVPETTLSEQDVRDMLKARDFFCKTYDWSKAYSNPDGKGLQHDYVLQKNGQVVYDRATGLMWEQAGSPEYMTYEEAQAYVARRRSEKFAGYTDWRLPTLEEAMSLMEPTEKNGDLYIAPVFDKTQRWIWTADKNSAGVAWFVYFDDGYCVATIVLSDGYYVRAVRSGQS